MSDTYTGVTRIARPKQQWMDLAASGREAPAKPRPTSSADLYAAPATSSTELLFFLLAALALLIGWQARTKEYLTAESGLGYALGVAGGALMLLLLLYPLRKRVRFMRNWGAIKSWFQAHMMMGVLGPVLILFHSNFRGGSLNSTVALLSMLLVAGSGFVGRYIYTKIHYGLYGSQMTLKELQYEIENYMTDVVWILHYAPKVQQRLLAFDTAILRPHHSFLHSVWQFLIIGIRTHWTHVVLLLSLRRALKVTSRDAGWSALELKQRRRDARRHISAHTTTAIRIAKFSVYERLFALWHLFHLPLTFLFLIAAVIHVIAVHMY